MSTVLQGSVFFLPGAKTLTEVKPHLTYQQQLAKMRARGLTYKDHILAIQSLKRIGYYRLSAYTYPFRILDESQSTPVLRDEFERGTTFEDALYLYAFDEKLRTILLEGLNAIEIGLGVQVGYTLGKRSPIGHENVNDLNVHACNEVISYTSDGTPVTQYAAWRMRYEKLLVDAKNEVYVQHHQREYGGHFPVWVATEFMDFGCLLRLFDMLRTEDKKKIALAFGVDRDGHEVLFKWLKALNVLRNHCAHSNRVWNRATVNAPGRYRSGIVDARLHHLNAIADSERPRIYIVAAIVAYLSTKINPQTNWPRTFATQVKKFKSVRGRTVGTEMGFPEDWEQLDLWNWDPKAK